MPTDRYVDWQTEILKRHSQTTFAFLMCLSLRSFDNLFVFLLCFFCLQA